MRGRSEYMHFGDSGADPYADGNELDSLCVTSALEPTRYRPPRGEPLRSWPPVACRLPPCAAWWHKRWACGQRLRTLFMLEFHKRRMPMPAKPPSRR